MDEGHDSVHIGRGQRKTRHARRRSSSENHRFEFVAAHILGDQIGTREVRTCFAALRIPAVTKTTLRNELRFTCLNIGGGIRLS